MEPKPAHPSTLYVDPRGISRTGALASVQFIRLIHAKISSAVS
jgi:hypothetical protein